MKYSIGWIDATLKENWNFFRRYYLSQGVELEKEEDQHDGWVDFEATYRFEAENDQEAKKMAKSFIDSDDRIDVFSLSKGDQTIFTEEDL